MNLRELPIFDNLPARTDWLSVQHEEYTLTLELEKIQAVCCIGQICLK